MKKTKSKQIDKDCMSFKCSQSDYEPISVNEFIDELHKQGSSTNRMFYKEYLLEEYKNVTFRGSDKYKKFIRDLVIARALIELLAECMDQDEYYLKRSIHLDEIRYALGNILTYFEDKFYEKIKRDGR